MSTNDKVGLALAVMCLILAAMAVLEMGVGTIYFVGRILGVW